MRVLVADDQRPNLKMMTAIITALGHSVDLAEDGKRASDMASVTSYDIIFMDIHMPVMDGLEAIARIRKMPGTKPRLVVVTADISEETRMRALSVGADFVETKPVTVAKIQQALDLTNPA